MVWTVSCLRTCLVTVDTGVVEVRMNRMTMKNGLWTLGGVHDNVCGGRNGYNMDFHIVAIFVISLMLRLHWRAIKSTHTFHL